VPNASPVTRAKLRSLSRTEVEHDYDRKADGPNTVPTLVRLAYRATEANIAVLSTHCQPHRKRVTSIAGVAEPFEIHLTTEAALHALN
jgi:hypothetical protein